MSVKSEDGENRRVCHDRLCAATVQYALAARTPKQCMEALFMLESLINHEAAHREPPRHKVSS